MTREEAIKILASSCIPGSKQTEALETLIPELAESEDERIRKKLVEYHSQQFEKNRDQEIGLFHKDALAWLEKQKEQKPSEDELAKRHLEGYIMGREDTMREMKDFLESHFNTNKAKEGEDLTDLYRKEYAQPLCLRNGGVCTNPMRDCINCIPTLERFNTTSGTSTATLHGNTSATDGKEHNPSFTD